MVLKYASINSGSNGNCYYVGSDKAAVLIDAGISCRETERRLRSLGLKTDNIQAIFISHEHGDHIYGVETLAKRYGLPVYANFKTGEQIRKKIPMGLLKRIDQDESVELGDLKIKAFSKSHDAADPLSFIITGHEITIGVFTDIGWACENLKRHFRQCHAAFLEANYDEEMLENGKYPFHLKNRIRSNQGHLSNQQALELFEQHRPSHMTHLVLSHLSKENNSQEKALSYFERHRSNTEIEVASREGASELWLIKSQLTKDPTYGASLQLPLF